MITAYRQGPPGFPYVWEEENRSAARWNALGDGPTQYFANCPDAAWAEFLRHECIDDPTDLQGIERTVWAVEIDDSNLVESSLSSEVLLGSLDSYAVCHHEAQRLRTQGEKGISAPSAALRHSSAAPWHVDSGLQLSAMRDARTFVFFGLQPTIEAWKVVEIGRPGSELLDRIRPL